jgi:sugar phosphate permease
LEVANRIYYGYWIVFAAFFAQFVSLGILSYTLGAFMTPMIEALGWSRAEFTLSRSISQVVMAITGFIMGGYVDRLGGRPLMLTGTVILATALVGHSFITTLWQWIVLNGLVLTVGCAMIGNLVVNVTLAKWFVEKRGLAVAWSAMGVSFAGVVITPLLTLLIDEYGWRFAWQVLGVASVIILIPISMLMRRAPEDHGLHPDGRSDADVLAGHAQRAADDFARSLTRVQALHTLSFYALVLAFGLFSINIVVMLLQAIPYLTDAGFGRTEAAFAITVASIPAMVSKPVWGFFIDRMRPQPLASISSALTAISLVCIVASVAQGELMLIYASFFLLGVGWGGMIPLQEVIWGSFFGRRYLGAVRSAGLPVALGLSAAAPWLVSLYHDSFGAYDGALLIVAGLNMLSAVMLLVISPPAVKAT